MARPRKPYRTSWGEFINGLRQHGSAKRWIICETGETFTEPDERRAIAHFKRWQSKQAGHLATLTTPVKGKHARQQARQGLDDDADLVRHWDGSTSLVRDVPEAELWLWMRQQLLTRPEHAATMTGIPEVARLADLPQRGPSPKLVDVGTLYEKSDAGKDHKRAMAKWWRSFTDFTHGHEVKTLRALTPQLCAEYADSIKAGKDSPKYIKHRFNGIKTMLNFALKRGENPDDCRHAIDCCKVMEAPKHKGRRKPQPISREDFHKLLAASADNPKLKASILAMLNLCMYPGEALALNWEDLDLTKGTVVTERPKTDIVRIGVLWQRTIEALEAIKPSSAKGAIFLSNWGNRWHINSHNWNIRQLRSKAGVNDKVKTEHLRDGAYTAAIESGCDLTQAKLLGGHATGISDHYAQRRPTMVADACKAIEKAYFD
ncbi:tyrosine-type recombinase/integrase [Phycisphaerales bacterium AB-hyl4]|uniref:Tyrosine-type recombinase/integrase n=1 Tax=Natronomicrosphaera hydrolytica TaxID=3242702 RepID=A0ABV4U2K6_9BACT